MIFFTTFVTLIRREKDGTERRLGSPARVEGNTIRLPIGTEVEIGDYVEYHPPHGGLQMMSVIDVIYPHAHRASTPNDHIEVTCTPTGQMVAPDVMIPPLHPAISGSVALMKDGRMSEAVFEVFSLVEERVQALTARKETGQALMELVFGPRPPQLDITTATGQAARDEQDGFQYLFIGAMIGLRDPLGAGAIVPITTDEALEYLAVASMLMRRLDRAESRLG